MRHGHRAMHIMLWNVTLRHNMFWSSQNGDTPMNDDAIFPILMILALMIVGSLLMAL